VKPLIAFGRTAELSLTIIGELITVRNRVNDIHEQKSPPPNNRILLDLWIHLGFQLPKTIASPGSATTGGRNCGGRC